MLVIYLSSSSPHGLRANGAGPRLGLHPPFDHSNLQHERVIVEINKTAGGRYAPRAIVVDLEPSSQDRVRAEAFGQLFGAGSSSREISWSCLSKLRTSERCWLYRTMKEDCVCLRAH